MTQNRRDAAPSKANGKRLAAPGAGEETISAAQVTDYLRRHPDFLGEHPELFDVLRPPARDRGDGVVDLQQFMVERLRNELAEMAAKRDELVVTGRNNLSAQARVHKAILALLGARSFENFIEIVTTDLAVILDLDVVTIGVEQTGGDLAPAPTSGVCRLEAGMVDRLLGQSQDIALRPHVSGDPAIFGAGAGLVCSDVLIRLSISRASPAALLALGSRQPNQFHPGQGTELLSFLARVVESCIRGWLNLPE
ncbi:MAG: DUF484 family protein [Kiloniellaceae bacterium]